jgi:ATP-dependent exoDNAse (exonuclease V) beta subunit
MFAAHTTQVVNESLCLLYVAMTRAIRALYLFIAPSKPNEKNLPKTFAGVLRGALCPDAQALPETRLYDHGATDWQQEHAMRPAPAAEEAVATPISLTVRLREANRRRGRGLERLRPSDRRGRSSTSAVSLLQPGTTLAMRRGALLHAWLEQIEWLDQGEPHDTALRQAAGRMATATLDVEVEIQNFRRMINMPQTHRVLSRDGYADLAALGFSQDCLPISNTRRCR